MTAVAQLVSLLNTTEGRDKLVKALGGLSRAYGFYHDGPFYEKMAKSMSEGRSLMRIGAFVNNYKKLRDTAEMDPAARKPVDLVMAVRVLADAGFVINDNTNYLSKYKMVQFDGPAAVKRGIRCQVLGFFLASLMDIFHLLTMRRSAFASDADFRVEQRKRRLMLFRNLCDFFASLANSKLVESFQLSPGIIGILGLTSGAVATSEIWAKHAAKKK